MLIWYNYGLSIFSSGIWNISDPTRGPGLLPASCPEVTGVPSVSEAHRLCCVYCSQLLGCKLDAKPVDYTTGWPRGLELMAKERCRAELPAARPARGPLC